MSWVRAGEAQVLTKARKTVIDVDGYEVVVLAHDGAFYAFQNRCIHKQRELAKGVILNGKIVCPGHQWAFALDSGWEAVKEECQPRYEVRVVDGVVEIDVTVPDELIVSTSGATAASVVPVDVATASESSPTSDL